jgi:hypothetical protein
MAGVGGNQVLEEVVDVNYEPTEQEVKDYAEWLGMDVDVDTELLWIAREGLRAPLPAPWKPCEIIDTNEIFYFNFETGESVWDHPVDEFYKEMYRSHSEEAKRKAEAPKRIVTLQATPEADGKLTVSCTNMGGDEVGNVSMGRKRTLDKLAKELGRQMELSKDDIQMFRFVLTDGQLLTENDQLHCLGEIFGLSSNEKSKTKTQSISVLQQRGAHLRHQKKEKRHKPKTPVASDGSDVLETTGLSKTPTEDLSSQKSPSSETAIGPLPPLKIDANKTRIAKLKKTGGLELSRYLGDILDMADVEKGKTSMRIPIICD